MCEIQTFIVEVNRDYTLWWSFVFVGLWFTCLGIKLGGEGKGSKSQAVSIGYLSQLVRGGLAGEKM